MTFLGYFGGGYFGIWVVQGGILGSGGARLHCGGGHGDHWGSLGSLSTLGSSGAILGSKRGILGSREGLGDIFGVFWGDILGFGFFGGVFWGLGALGCIVEVMEIIGDLWVL